MATLQEYLDAQGETQAQFGRRAGVRQQVVSRWASGFAIPRPHFIATVERLTNRQVQAADFYMAHAARRHGMEMGQQAGDKAAAKARVEALAAGATPADADLEAEHAGMEAAALAEDVAYRDHLKRARAVLLRASAKAERIAQAPEAAAA